jgi:hypothetical protein
MAGEREAASVLTLVVAVCDEAIQRLDALKPPLEGGVRNAAIALRDLAAGELEFGRLRRRPAS